MKGRKPKTIVQAQRDRIKSLGSLLEASEKEHWIRGMEIVKLEKLFYAHESFHTKAYLKAVKKVFDEFDDRCIVKGKKQREKDAKK